MDVLTTGFAVQVALLLLKMVVAVEGHELVAEATGVEVFGGIASGIADIKVCDKGVVRRCRSALLVEQVDMVTLRAAALVQVLVDEHPALRYILLHQHVGLHLVALAYKHYLADILRLGPSRDGCHQHQGA